MIETGLSFVVVQYTGRTDVSLFDQIVHFPR